MRFFYECLKFMGNKPIFNPPHVGDLMKDLEDVHKNLNIKNAFDHKNYWEKKQCGYGSQDPPFVDEHWINAILIPHSKIEMSQNLLTVALGKPKW